MKVQDPLVSVICISFNHRDFVVEALQSVLDQTYKPIELIVVDDASTDGSQEVILNFCQEHENVKSILLEKNQGNCRAFNTGWVESSGKYLIDLAADDMLHRTRVEAGVRALENKGEKYGVNFTDAKLIDSRGNKIGLHRTADFINPVPEGYIFKDLLSRYFINPVSMMLSDKMLVLLGGFDESLAYEDFDLWIRSSKEFAYCYTPEVLVSKRVLKGSYSTRQYKTGSKLLQTTYKVCLKAYELCEADDEFESLLIRVNYEMKKAGLSLNIKTGLAFLNLRAEIKKQLKAKS